MFEIFEKLKAGLEQSARTNFHGFQKQGLLPSEPSSQGANAITAEKFNRLQLVLDEAVKLSIKICVADAVHDNTIAERVKSLQSRALPLLNALAEQVRGITDHASVLRCRRSCERLMEEVQRDVLSTEADVPGSGGGGSSPNRATVNEPRTHARTHACTAARLARSPRP